LTPSALLPIDGTNGPGSESLQDVQRAHILTVLERCHWIIEKPGRAAERLGMNPSTLRHRMRKLGIVRPRRRT
jgi:transcriptional regulator with GAF, ATPase, and Fis domain